MWAAIGLTLLLLSLAAWRVPWRTLPHGAVSAWSAACVLLAAMWLVKAGLQPGLSFHLLGAAIFTLLMGPALALLALALVLLLQAAAGQLGWLALGLNFCVTLLPAVAVTALALRLAQRYLPAHLFVYVFVNAFLAGGLSLIVAAASGMALLWLQGCTTGPTCWTTRCRSISCCRGRRRLPAGWCCRSWWCTGRSGCAVSMTRAIWRAD
ncbi:energy-coupling factor ABC transporter permease [Vogesella fluminis]|uniref:energy-coupling factor ABC transporter permease n=1 Tax=Vogesella fluminis TaxID=1069161 RepID=UPI00363BB5BD